MPGTAPGSRTQPLKVDAAAPATAIASRCRGADRILFIIAFKWPFALLSPRIGKSNRAHYWMQHRRQQTRWKMDRIVKYLPPAAAGFPKMGKPSPSFGGNQYLFDTARMASISSATKRRALSRS
jgi:hypothetical protein